VVNSPDSVTRTTILNGTLPLVRLEPLALLAPAGIWLGLLLVLPTLVIFELSLVPGNSTGDVVNSRGLDNYAQVFEQIYLQVIGRSLFFAVSTTVICLLLGFPVAYWIALLLPSGGICCY